jgi:hypothetical protein
MGSYTHEWERPSKFNVATYHHALHDCKKMVDVLVAQKLLGESRLCYGDNHPEDQAYFGVHKMQFNGFPSLAMADNFDMPLYTSWHKMVQSFYCRTDLLPYDLAVCCCLIVFHCHFPKHFFVKSPKDNPNWDIARHLCQAVLNFGKDFSLDRAANRHLTNHGLPLRKARHRHPIENEGERDQPRWELGLSGLFITKVSGWDLFKKVNAYAVNTPWASEPIKVKRTLLEAQWWATVYYLQVALDETSIYSFFEAAYQQDWTALKAAADWLEERGNPKADLLRSYFPKERKKRAQPSDQTGTEDQA